jgi:predicted AAA+ superfamily ATPase
MMHPFSCAELKEDFDLEFAIKWGNLPLVVQDKPTAADTLAAYVQAYLTEEIRQEGLVRRLESFNRFLRIAGLLNGQMINLDGLAREAQVKKSTADSWFSILEDTLICCDAPPLMLRI